MNGEAAATSAETVSAEAAPPEPAAAAPAAAPAPEPPRGEVVRPSPTLARIALLVSLLALLVAGWQWWEMRSRAAKLHTELAQRLSEADNVAKESRLVSKQTQEALTSLQGKVGALEAKLADSQSQRLALEAAYQELARSRDDRVLAEVEQAINLAAQQLQLAGNVETALIALQSADARLARADQAQFLPLRKMLIRDIERLKALPLVDVPGLSLKLDHVAGSVDGMPLAFESVSRGSDAGNTVEAAAQRGFWATLWRDLWSEISHLVRIERLDRPDPAVLSPQNAFMLRENLKLRLINARLALLQRDSRTYREDITQAEAWIERYFDLKAKPTQDALATLRQLSGARLVLEIPNLDDSLTALRNLKIGREKGGLGAR